MKKILFLLLVTISSYGQTLQNPTFGNTTTNTLKIKTPATVTSVNFLSTVEADGSFAKILPSNTPGSIKTMVYEGDSITAYTIGPSYGTTNYPTQIINYNADVARATQINVATSGERLATFISSGQYASQVQPNKPSSNKEKVLFCLMIGCNDLGDGTTPATVYANLKTVWAQAKADGFTVVAFTVTRSTISLRDTGAVTLGGLIASDPTLYDYLIRTDLILPNAADLTYFESDGIHLNANGSKKLAQQLNEVLEHQINGYNSNEVALSVINGKTDLQSVSATSIVKKGATSTDALLAGGGTLPFPIGAGGTGVANYIPMYTAPGFIGLSKIAHSSSLDVLYVDSKMSVGLAPSYATPVGQFDIKTGSTLSYNLAGQDMGSISFGNASGSANIPSIIGKSTDNRGLFFIAASPDANSASDFEFNIRRNTDTDYTTMTGGGFRWVRQNTQLMLLSRTGVLNITNLAGATSALLETDTAGNISRSSVLMPTSGTYTPTLTNTTNLTSATLSTATYIRVGDIVTVTLSALINVTTTNTLTTLTATLPVNRVSTVALEVGSGVGFQSGYGAQFFPVHSQMNTNTTQVNFFCRPTNSGNHTLTASFSYKVN